MSGQFNVSHGLNSLHFGCKLEFTIIERAITVSSLPSLSITSSGYYWFGRILSSSKDLTLAVDVLKLGALRGVVLDSVSTFPVSVLDGSWLEGVWVSGVPLWVMGVIKPAEVMFSESYSTLKQILINK